MYGHEYGSWSLRDLFPVGADSDDCAFVGVKFHLHSFLPISPALINLPGGGLGLDLT